MADAVQCGATLVGRTWHHALSAGEELPIQHAYGGESFCFGCGKCNEDGLQLKSYRIKGGLLAKISLQKKHLCFPGIISGGIITTLFDCHGRHWFLHCR